MQDGAYQDGLSPEMIRDTGNGVEESCLGCASGKMARRPAIGWRLRLGREDLATAQLATSPHYSLLLHVASVQCVCVSYHPLSPYLRPVHSLDH